MRYIFALLLAVGSMPAQTGTSAPASIAGTVVDAATLKPIPGAIVIAGREGVPPLARNTRSGGDGAFQIQGLTPGNYSLCVQAGDQCLDPCQWNASPVKVALSSGQSAGGIAVRLAASSVVTIQVKDPQQVLKQPKRDGSLPDLSVGVWGPTGLYYPAHTRAGLSESVNSKGGGGVIYSYRVVVPRDTPLSLHFASRDLRLGDAGGTVQTLNRPPMNADERG